MLVFRGYVKAGDPNFTHDNWPEGWFMTADELDKTLGWDISRPCDRRSHDLVRRGVLPCIVLPNGEPGFNRGLVRFLANHGLPANDGRVEFCEVVHDYGS